MKYIIQQYEYDCVAVAVFNAMRYYDRNVSYRRLSKLRRRLKTGKKVRGTEFSDLKNVLTSVFNFEIEHCPVNRSKILRHLQNSPILLQCPSGNGHGHLMFIEKYLPGQDKIVFTNWNNKRKVKIVTGPMKETHFCILINSPLV